MVRGLAWKGCAVIFGLCLLLSISSCHGAASVPIYTSPNGLPTNNGSAAAPYDLFTALNMSHSYLLSGASNVSLFFYSGFYPPLNASESWSFTSSVDAVFNMIGLDPNDPPVITLLFGLGLNPNVAGSTFTLNMANLIFPNCGQAASGDSFGCIYIYGYTFYMKMTNVQILNSGHSLAAAGAVYIDAFLSGSLAITDSIFAYNYAYNGAAVFLQSTQGTVNAYFKNSQFIGNTAAVGGGTTIFYLADVNVVSFEDCIIENNSAAYVLFLSQNVVPIVFYVINTQIVYNEAAVIGYPLASGAQYFLRVSNQSAIAFNTAGLSVPSTSNISIASDSIVWGNQGTDLTCTGTGVAVLASNGVDLCATINTCNTQGTRWDRCFVCNGTDACLGCSAGNCQEFVLIPPNQKTYTTSITYPGGGNPDPTMFPLNSQGQSDPNRFLQIEFVDIQEIRSDGSVVLRLPLNSQSFLVTSAIQTNATSNLSTISFGYFNTQYKTAISIFQTYFLDSTILYQRNLTFSVNPQTLKVSISISNWPFEGGINSTNTLSIKIRTHTGEPINNQQNTTTTIGGVFQQTETNFSTSSTLGILSFLQVAEFNRNGTFHELAAINVFQLANESNSTSNTFIMQFQGYFDQVLYDPDFGVLVAPQGTSSSGDGGSNLGLIIGLSVGIPVAFLIVLLVIGAGTAVTFIVRHKKRAKLQDHLAQMPSNTSGIHG